MTTGRSSKVLMQIENDRVREKVNGEILGGLLWPAPWIALNPTFESDG